MTDTPTLPETVENLETAFRCRRRADDLRVIAEMLDSTDAQRVLLMTADEYESMASALDRCTQRATVH